MECTLLSFKKMDKSTNINASADTVTAKTKLEFSKNPGIKHPIINEIASKITNI